jgi:hypothetical protein
MMSSKILFPSVLFSKGSYTRSVGLSVCTGDPTDQGVATFLGEVETCAVVICAHNYENYYHLDIFGGNQIVWNYPEPIIEPLGSRIEQHLSEPIIQRLGSRIEKHLSEPIIQRLGSRIEQHLSEPIIQQLGSRIEQHLSEPIIRQLGSRIE